MGHRMSKVWNDDTRVYRERFLDREVEIPAKSYIVMDHSEAVQFMGRFTSAKKDGQGRPVFVKRLRLERLMTKDPLKMDHKCNFCAAEFSKEQELLDHCVGVHNDKILKEEKPEKKGRTVKAS